MRGAFPERLARYARHATQYLACCYRATSDSAKSDSAKSLLKTDIQSTMKLKRQRGGVQLSERAVAPMPLQFGWFGDRRRWR